MKEKGAASVRAVATHCIMSGPASERVQDSALRNWSSPTVSLIPADVPKSSKLALPTFWLKPSDGWRITNPSVAISDLTRIFINKYNISQEAATDFKIRNSVRPFSNTHKLMKTKNLFISGLIVFSSSCSSQNCKIEGTVENAKDGDTLYLARMSDGNFTPTDTIILHQGKFTLQEKCDSTIIASFFFYDQESNEVYSNIFFMEKGNIQLNIGPEGRVSGTENKRHLPRNYRFHLCPSRADEQYLCTTGSVRYGRIQSG